MRNYCIDYPEVRDYATHCLVLDPLCETYLALKITLLQRTLYLMIGTIQFETNYDNYIVKSLLH